MKTCKKKGKKKGGQKPKSRQVNNTKEINHKEIKELQTTSKFRFKTMYVYYIAMEFMFLFAQIFFHLSIFYV
jgi:hypothetical protein